MKIYHSLDDLLAAAETGDADAQYELGLGYITGICKGETVGIDGTQAFTWMMQAAEQGHAAAMENIGHAYLHGFMGIDATRRFLRIDREKGLEWLQKAAVAGAAGACRALGLFFRYDDPHKATGYFFKAAYYFGDTLALRYYGEALFKGDGITEDRDAARQVLLSALSMDDTLTRQDAAALKQEYGVAAEAPADDAARADRRARAEAYYLAALARRAEAGDPAGQYELALRHYLGRGVPQDMAAARDWLGRAAEAGYAPARKQQEALAGVVRH